MKENDLHMMSRDAEFDKRCRSLLEGREVIPPPIRPGIIAEASPMWNRTRAMAAGVLVLAAAAWWFSGGDDAAVDSGDAPVLSVPMDAPAAVTSTTVPVTPSETLAIEPQSEGTGPESVEANPPAEVEGDSFAADRDETAERSSEAQEPVATEAIGQTEWTDGVEHTTTPGMEANSVESARQAVDDAAEATLEPATLPAQGDEENVDGEGAGEGAGGEDSQTPDAPKIRLPLTLPSGGGQR
jgi:hypothetical protein